MPETLHNPVLIAGQVARRGLENRLQHSLPSSYLVCCRWLLQRRHIDHESKLHIAPEHSFVGFVNLLDRDQFDLRLDLVLRAEVEHFQGLLDG